MNVSYPDDMPMTVVSVPSNWSWMAFEDDHVHIRHEPPYPPDGTGVKAGVWIQIRSRSDFSVVKDILLQTNVDPDPILRELPSDPEYMLLACFTGCQNGEFPQDEVLGWLMDNGGGEQLLKLWAVKSCVGSPTSAGYSLAAVMEDTEWRGLEAVAEPSEHMEGSNAVLPFQVHQVRLEDGRVYFTPMWVN